MDQLLNSYYEDNAKKLHTVINKIFNKHYGGTTGRDMEEFYGIGTDVLTDIWAKHEKGKSTYDSSKGDFDGYVYRAISMAITDEFKRQNRDKRATKVYLLDENGEKVLDEETGKPIKISVSDVRLDAPIKEDSNITQGDMIQSDFDVETELFENSKKYQDEKVQVFLENLPIIQRQIIEMKMEDIPVFEIKQKLEISDKEYNDAINAIKENRLISLFNKNSKNKQRKLEDKPMKEKVIINDNDLVMDIDTTDNHRVDTVTLDSLLEDKACGELDCNYISQREPFQWSDEQINKFYSRILNNQPIPEIVVCETVEAGEKVSYLVEGLQRMSYAEAFKNNRIPVKAKGAEFTKIKYKKYVYDKSGNKVKDENGRPEFTIEVFDIVNKYYKDLPEFLQKRFDKYNITVTRFFNCTYKMIDYHIRNYNNHEGMTKSHYGITSVSNKVSTSIKGLSQKHPFFMNNVKCTNKSRKRGALEEMVARSIMATFFIDDWKRECIDAFKFVDSHITDEQLEKFTDNVTRLSKVADRTVKEFFTTTNTHIWLAVFNVFSNLGIEDERFIDFMKHFESSLKDKSINGRTFNEVNKRNTKDKITVKNKINVLVDLMMDYLHIDEDKIADIQEQSVEEFVAESLNIDAEEISDEIDFYNESLDALFENRVKLGSNLRQDQNRPSLLAMLIYSYKENVDIVMEKWLEEYANKNNTYFVDQKRNFLHMKKDFERYCIEHKMSA